MGEGGGVGRYRVGEGGDNGKGEQRQSSGGVDRWGLTGGVSVGSGVEG